MVSVALTVLIVIMVGVHNSEALRSLDAIEAKLDHALSHDKETP